MLLFKQHGVGGREVLVRFLERFSAWGGLLWVEFHVNCLASSDMRSEWMRAAKVATTWRPARKVLGQTALALRATRRHTAPRAPSRAIHVRPAAVSCALVALLGDGDVETVRWYFGRGNWTHDRAAMVERSDASERDPPLSSGPVDGGRKYCSRSRRSSSSSKSVVWPTRLYEPVPI